MSLKERLKEDLKASMKEKDTLRKNTIQLTRASILQYEKDNKVVLDDNQVAEIIQKEWKKRKSNLPEFEKSGRKDLIENLEREIDILSEYMPKQLSEDELRDIVLRAINEVSATSMKDMGKIMANVMPKIKGKADGSIVNKIVKETLK